MSCVVHSDFSLAVEFLTKVVLFHVHRVLDDTGKADVGEHLRVLSHTLR